MHTVVSIALMRGTLPRSISYIIGVIPSISA